jgi:hypothetical protein
MVDSERCYRKRKRVELVVVASAERKKAQSILACQEI